MAVAIQRSPSQLQRRPSRLLDQIERSRKLSGVPEGAAEPGAPAGRGGRGAAVALETAGARGKGRSRDKGAAGEAEPARAEAQAAVAEPSSNSPARTSSESDQPARSPTTVPPAYPPAPPPPASPPPSSSPPAPVPARSVPAPAATGRGPSAPARAAPQPAVLQRKHEHLPKPRPKSDFAALHSAPFEFVALARPDASPRQRQRQRLTVMGPVGVLGPSTDGLNQHSDRDPYSHERPLAAAKRHSEMFEHRALNVASPEQRRTSRLPASFQLDPFGFALNADTSPFDLAAPKPLRPSPSHHAPPSPSRSFRSLYAGPGPASASAVSLGAHSLSAPSPQPWHAHPAARSREQLFPPPAWQPQKPRSQSFGEAMNPYRGARSPSRASYMGGGGARMGGLAPPPAGERRSKLSGEVKADDPASPELETTSSSSPPHSPLAPTSDSAYAALTQNSKMYQRMQKAQKQLEKERAKAAAKGPVKLAQFEAKLAAPSGSGATIGRSASILARKSAPALSSSAASIAESTRSSRISGLGWFKTKSEAVLDPRGRAAAAGLPPSPALSSTASVAMTDALTVSSSTRPSSRDPSPGSRKSLVEELADVPDLDPRKESLEAGPVRRSSLGHGMPAAAPPRSPPSARTPILIETPASPMDEARDSPPSIMPDTPPGGDGAALHGEAAPSAKGLIVVEPIITPPETPRTTLELPRTSQELDKGNDQALSPTGLLPSPIPYHSLSCSAQPPSPVIPHHSYSLDSPRPSYSASPRPSVSSFTGRSVRSNSSAPKPSPTINLAVVTGQQEAGYSLPTPIEPARVRRKSSFVGLFVRKSEDAGASGSFGSRHSVEKGRKRAATVGRPDTASSGRSSHGPLSSSVGSGFFSRARKLSAPAPAASRASSSDVRQSAIPISPKLGSPASPPPPRQSRKSSLPAARAAPPAADWNSTDSSTLVNDSPPGKPVAKAKGGFFASLRARKKSGPPVPKLAAGGGVGEKQLPPLPKKLHKKAAAA